MANLVFKEMQSYKGTWVMYLILVIELPIILLVATLIWNTENGMKEGLWGLGIVVLIVSLVFMLLMLIRLETRIDEYGVKFRFFPFISSWRTFPKSQIRQIQIINYSPLTDYGGWGLKGNRTTKAYSIIGDEGILLDIGEKKKIMIGTQKGKELRSYLEDWLESE
ncbi:hypothetical protein [Algoriphagus taiwanensis]|uniref:PH domain-containing protein n=1 Tax=Algoriphagus taiwanensis TaxID=1445656 RepID=A0ABQ6Q774_9BACT|nr:hypothetical protein Ataiwa_39740 [Algoriphagus taiwanensis]